MEKIKNADYTAKIALIMEIETDAEKILNSKSLYDFFIFVPEGDDEKFSMYWICRFCEDSQDMVKKMNILKYEKGFWNVFKFPTSFQGNFYGSKV